ncbi:hypothetical protein GC176_16560 [bacterium]|nr:hypothetical protein [bacterium]
MAIDADLQRIGRSCDTLARPDPRLNASQIIAWAICWPWNLLWTLCVYNPFRYVIEFVVQEFHSTLDEISSGRFRDIEDDLNDVSDGLIVAPFPEAHPGRRSAIVVGDPMPGWNDPESLATVNSQSVNTQSASSVAKAAAIQQVATDGNRETAMPGEAAFVWTPPEAVRSCGTPKSVVWHSSSTMASSPAVLPSPLSSTHSQRAEAAEGSERTMQARRDPWNDPPPAPYNRNSPTLN